MKALLLAILVAACMPAPAYAGPPHTHVFVNGQELTIDQKTQLDALVGIRLPAGRYWVDAHGNAGIEGQPARVNLYALARQRPQHRGKPTTIYSRGVDGRGSSFVSDGHGCAIASTPGMTIATPGC
jgi:hypothetical protein